MQKVPLGSQGLVTSALGLGCMGMSAFYGGATEAGSVATIRRALDLGITLFDTAEAYGPFENERLLGQVLGSVRESVVVASKFATDFTDDGQPIGLDGSPEHARPRHRPCRPLVPPPGRPERPDRGHRRRDG
jgi:aryl-alcohol dehydrogenase-like predicted oxidoreductase